MSDACSNPDQLPEEAWIVALLSLPGLGPSRLRLLLEAHGARGAWDRLCRGDRVTVESVRPHTLEGWRSAARLLSVRRHWETISGLGVSVAAHGSLHYPTRLNEDIEPPRVLFSIGGEVPSGPTVGIVGTRNCTSYGQRCAFELGAALASVGVCVVSGLALGIDAAAHRGALSILFGKAKVERTVAAGRPIGVVGSGLDVVYPKRNADLWEAVSNHGVLLSETPPGIGPQAWRFPARNRIIAGLSDALIVIESHERGGSLLTVDEAQLRDVPVGAVPGPITSNAAAGSNRLLVDGATPILDVGDVCALIGYAPPRSISSVTDPSRQSELLDVLGWTPLSFDQLCGRVDLSNAEVAIEVERLVSEGLCARSGPWIERVR